MANLVSNLRAELEMNIKDFDKLFGMAFRNMDSVKKHFVVTPTEQFVSLKRETIGNLFAPSGKDSTTTFASNIVTLDERIAETKDIKIDLKFTEAELQTMRRNYINSLDPADENDIFSLPGQEYIMRKIIAKATSEVAKGVYNGARGATGVTNGGTNLFDGLWVKFLAAFGTEISVANQAVYAAAAPTLTSANVLAEFKKFRDKIVANTSLFETYKAEGGTTFISPEVGIMISDAMDASLSNSDQVFMKTNMGYVMKGLEEIPVEPVNWLTGSTNFFSTLPGNLHFMPGNEKAEPSFVVQQVLRDLVILGDAKAGVDFAYGGGLMFYRGYGTWN
jgi:hypothetical protein